MIKVEKEKDCHYYCKDSSAAMDDWLRSRCGRSRGGAMAAKGRRGSSSCVCVTKEEIAKYWRRKKMEEEEHLFSAIKAAARIKSQTLTEADYHKFEESLESKAAQRGEDATMTGNQCSSKEIRLGIKDWWTRSWYAYLNQPAVQSADGQRFAKSNYVPNLRCYTPLPSHNTTFGVF